MAKRIRISFQMESAQAVELQRRADEYQKAVKLPVSINTVAKSLVISAIEPKVKRAGQTTADSKP